MKAGCGLVLTAVLLFVLLCAYGLSLLLGAVL